MRVPASLRSAVAAALVCGFAGASGCNSTTPSSTTTVNTPSNQYFSSSLAPGGSAVFTFTTTAVNTIGVTYAAAVSAANGSVLSAPLTVTLGTVAGAACTPLASSTSVSAAPALTAQVQTSSAAVGTYCASVKDAGGLTEAATVTLRVGTSVGTPSFGTAITGTDFISSVVAQGGSTTRTDNLAQSGPINVNLSSLGIADATVKLGFGVWDGAACRLNTSLITAAGTTAQITTNADGGAYCIFVADPGTLTHTTTFTLSLGHS